MIYLGTEYGGWAIEPTLIYNNSIIYSAGIGTDISFDLELIKKFNVNVHGFDPTPRSLKWIKTQNIPKQFFVHEYGISNFDGISTFAFPEKEEYVSFKEDNSCLTNISLPVKRISTIMKELNHDYLDILKMDIEGSEYNVIDDILTNNIFPTQLLIEFHDVKVNINVYIEKLKNFYVLNGFNNKDFYFIKK